MNSEFFRYPTVTEQDRAWGLYVTGGGFVSVAPKSPYPLEVHPPSYQFRWPQRRVLDEYQMFLIARGEGEFESGAGGRRPIKRGNVAITFPGQWHRYRPVPSVGWDQYWIGFRGEIADRLLHRGLLRAELPVLDVPLDETVMRPFQRLLTCLQNDPPGAHQLMAGSIIEILGATLAAARAGRHPDREAEMVQQAKVLLERKSEDNPTIEAIARQLEISGTHFRRVFKRQTGMSPYQYQLQMRINRAREMLHGTALPVQEVAAAVGFENPYHFSATFKRKTGISPTQWRRRHEAVESIGDHSGASSGDPLQETERR